MTVAELINVLSGINPNVIVMRESKELNSDYELKTVIMYATDSKHVFLKFVEE